jgi:hypothetical protein
MQTKPELVEKLQNGVVTVTFDKVNGEERVMKATLLSEYLPVQEDSGVPSREVSDEVIPVWDVEKQDWRSFRVDSVKKVLTE